MRNNRSDGNIMFNTLNRNGNANGVLMRPNSRAQINSYTQNVNTSLNAPPPLRSLRGRVDSRNLIQQHTSAVNLQNTIKRGANNGYRDIQSEQNSFQQQQIYSSVNDNQQENFLQQVNDKILGTSIHQRSQSLQKLKNLRENQQIDSPLKKITNWNNQPQIGFNNKGYVSITNQNNSQSQGIQKLNYKDTSELLKQSKGIQYQHIPKFSDLKDATLNINKGVLGQNQQNNSENQLGMSNNLINCNQIEYKYNIDPSKKSNRSYGIIKAYAANTNMGIFRNYNEDRVSIILSISKPFNKNVDYWPKTSFFAIYDGHGGSNCSDFLRDNLHLFIVRDECFPRDPTEAIKRGIQFAEQQFLTTAESNMDRSGSCAIIVMILDDVAYTVNIGDSRAIISINNGQYLQNLSIDHKPEDERQRIEAAGGKVYQQSIINNQTLTFQGVKISPPHRVFPGKLSVSRTIGDYEAKSQKYGGNPKVIISDPDIVVTKITQDHDFILLGCDGVFDRLSTQEVGKVFWNSAESIEGNGDNGEIDIHKQCGNGIEAVMRETFERKSLDNITLVAISFENFANTFAKILEKKQKEQEKGKAQNSTQLSQQVIMPPVIQNQQNIIPQSLQNNSNRGKLKQLHRNLNSNQIPSPVQQTYLFPKVSPTNALETVQNYSDETQANNQQNSEQHYSPSKQRVLTLQNEIAPNSNNNYLSAQSYQYIQPSQNNYKIQSNSFQNQTHLQNLSTTTSNSTNQNINMPLINQNQYSQNFHMNESNNHNNEITPFQENRISQTNFQSNSLNRHPSKQEIENAYFHKRARLNTPSTTKKYQNLPTSISNTSSTQLQIENSRMTMQSGQSLQTLKALQNDKLFLQLQQIQQQQKIINQQGKKK